MRVYATTMEYAAWLGLETAPAGATQALRTASLRVDELLLSAVYETDAAGKPTETKHIEALRDATCAQAAHVRAQGDPEGDGASPYKSVSFGSVSLTRAAPSDGSGSTAVYSSDAYSILQMAGLIPSEPWIL